MIQFFKLFALLAVLTFGLSSLVHGESPAPEESPSQSPEGKGGPGPHGGACKTLMEACKAAGFEPHGPAGKDIHRDCMHHLMTSGPSAVPSVKGVTQEEINQCKAQWGSHHRNKQ